MDATAAGLVGGTSQGYVANFPLEVGDGVRVNLTRLTDGQELIDVHTRRSFVGGLFFDAESGTYVARTIDLLGFTIPFQVSHATYIIGGGFMRMNLDLCYFSLSIDGRYVVSSVRRGKVLKQGNLLDLIQASSPTCVSVVDDGMVAVGTYDGKVFVIDVELDEVSSYLSKSPCIPRAMHMIRVKNAPYDYRLAWTSGCGRVVTATTSRRLFEKMPLGIVVTGDDRVTRDGLVKVKITDQDVVTVQSEAGKTYYRPNEGGSYEPMAGGWMLPIPNMENFAWHSNDNSRVSLMFVADVEASLA